jgi:hypothetical protein
MDSVCAEVACEEGVTSANKAKTAPIVYNTLVLGPDVALACEVLFEREECEWKAFKESLSRQIQTRRSKAESQALGIGSRCRSMTISPVWNSPCSERCDTEDKNWLTSRRSDVNLCSEQECCIIDLVIYFPFYSRL